MTEVVKDANILVWLSLFAVVCIMFVMRMQRRRRQPAKSKSRREEVEEALSAWRRTRDELEGKAGIKDLAEKARTSLPFSIYAGEKAASPAEEARRNQIEAHNIRLHFHQRTRDLYFTVVDGELRKQLIKHDIELERLTREQLLAESDEAKSDLRKAEAALASLQEELTGAAAKHLYATAVFQDLEIRLRREEERTFSVEEAQTGEPNEQWFIEQAWSTYPKAIEEASEARTRATQAD